MMNKVIVIRNSGADLVLCEYTAALYEVLLAANLCTASGKWGSEVWNELPDGGQLIIEIVDASRFVPKAAPVVAVPTTP